MATALLAISPTQPRLSGRGPPAGFGGGETKLACAMASHASDAGGLEHVGIALPASIAQRRARSGDGVTGCCWVPLGGHIRWWYLVEVVVGEVVVVVAVAIPVGRERG